jgi:hypothetical protein
MVRGVATPEVACFCLTTAGENMHMFCLFSIVSTALQMAAHIHPPSPDKEARLSLLCVTNVV